MNQYVVFEGMNGNEKFYSVIQTDFTSASDCSFFKIFSLKLDENNKKEMN